MQNLTPLLPTGIISRDRATINDNFDTLASNFSGELFPTSNLFAGMRCWRSDQKKMYQLNDDLVNWTVIDDLSQGYNTVAHANRADYATMDELGNKISETYTMSKDEGNIVLKCYPVGSIYMSVASTSPADLFGGIWQQIAGGRVLMGSSSSYRAGTTGGNESHTLTAANLPSHSHTGSVSIGSGGNHTHSGSTSTNGNHTHAYLTRNGTGVSSGGQAETESGTGAYNGSMTYAGDHAHSFSIGSSGSHSHTGTVSINSSGQANPDAISNMQPYLVVNMWQRIG